MSWGWLGKLRKHPVGVGAVVVFCVGIADSARGDEAQLRRLAEQQSRQIEDLKHRLGTVPPLDSAAMPEADNAGSAGGDATVRQIVSAYLRDYPGGARPRGRFPRFRWFSP